MPKYLLSFLFHDYSMQDRAIALEKTINFGKSIRHVTDRDLQDDLKELGSQREKFNDMFEELICTSPEDLAEIQDAIKKLLEKVSFWLLANTTGGNTKTDILKACHSSFYYVCVASRFSSFQIIYTLNNSFCTGETDMGLKAKATRSTANYLSS